MLTMDLNNSSFSVSSHCPLTSNESSSISPTHKWTNEEAMELAHLESIFVKKNKKKSLNRDLLSYFPKKSFGEIAARREMQEHKTFLDSCLHQYNDEELPPKPENPCKARPPKPTKPVKCRNYGMWMHDEMTTLATAELSMDPQKKAAVNAHLESLFPHRSLDSIREFRRTKKYKSLLKELASQQPPPPSPDSTSKQSFVISSPLSKCEICRKNFRNKLGCSVHMYRTHYLKWFEKVSQKKIKHRWSRLEIVELASKEHLLLQNDPGEDINVALCHAFPTFSKNSIKSIRRRSDYKAILSTLQDEPPVLGSDLKPSD